MDTTTAEALVGALIEIQALLIAWVIYPYVLGRTSQRG